MRNPKDPQKMAEGSTAIPNWNDLTPESSQDWESMTPESPEANQPTDKSLTGQTSTPNWDDLTPESDKKPENKYSTPNQQLLTVLEGAGQGIAGPLATGAELGLSKLGVPGLSAEDIAGRKEANPWEHGIAEGTALAGSMALGIGEAGLFAKGAAKLLPEALSVIGKLGSKVLSGTIQSMALQSGDEMTKAMLGQGDPEAPVSAALVNIGAAGLFGGAASGVFHEVGRGMSKGLQAIENAKLGDKANAARLGLGLAAQAHQMGIPAAEAEAEITNALGHLDDFNYKSIKPGVDLYYKGLKGAVDLPTDLLAGSIAGHASAIPGASSAAFVLSQQYLTPFVERLADKPLVGASKLIMPVVLNALEKGETSGLYTAINNATSISKGAMKMNKGIESIFKGAGHAFIEQATDKQKKQISDAIDKGGIQQDLQPAPTQGFADGGSIQAPQEDHYGKLYPVQSMLMNAAKSRVSNYLMSVKPQPPQKLTYDAAPSNKMADRSYDNALNIAANPLCIIQHIKDGNLQAENMKHLNSMFPEVVRQMQQKITQRIIQGKMDEESLPYKSRLSLSMFLGSPLDSTMTPVGIQAAQTAFLPKAPSQQPEAGKAKGKTKKGTTTLGKSNKSYKTADQAAESDRTARD